MRVSRRIRLGPAVALSVAGTLALSPAMGQPLAMTPAPTALLVSHIDDIELTGIGQDIYYAITPTVQYVVGGGSYLVNFLPIIGAPIAAQININYFQGIQPFIEATVNALAGVVQDPLNIVGTLTAYANTLYAIGYNWVSAELRWLGLSPLTPLPPLTSVRGASAPSGAPAATRARSSAAPAPRIGSAVREIRSGMAGAFQNPTVTAADAVTGGVRSSARTARGQASRTADQTRASVRPAPSPTG